VTPLRLTVYDAAPQNTKLPGGAARFIYCRAGRLALEDQSKSVVLSGDEGTFCDGGAQLCVEGDAWIYEVAPRAASFLPQARLILSHALHPAFDPPFLLRADRIESTPGAVTPRHGHRGPGVRRLVFGTLVAEVGDAIERIEAGDAWFETGRDPVVGTNVGPTNAAFVRVMVLPPELEGGKSSFVPADSAEAAKPRSVVNRLFGERLLSEGLTPPAG